MSNDKIQRTINTFLSMQIGGNTRSAVVDLVQKQLEVLSEKQKGLL